MGTVMNSGGGFALVFGGIFLACAGTFAGGLIWLLVAFILNLTRH
jgi:hypothetical protein